MMMMMMMMMMRKMTDGTAEAGWRETDMLIVVWCLCVHPGVSVDEAAGVVDSRPGASCRAVREVGDVSSSADDLLAVRLHFPDWIPHRRAPDVRQT